MYEKIPYFCAEFLFFLFCFFLASRIPIFLDPSYHLMPFEKCNGMAGTASNCEVELLLTVSFLNDALGLEL